MFKEERGVTLIEALVALAIVGLLLAGVFGFYMFGNVTFQRGIKQVYLQNSLRHAAEYITHQVRYAADLEVLAEGDPLPDGPAGVEEGYNYIFYGGEGDPRIYHLNADRLFPITEPLITEFILFPHPDNTKMIVIEIKAAEGGEEYAVKTAVIMLNSHPVLKPDEEYISAVRYKPPRP